MKSKFSFKYVLVIKYNNDTERYIGCKNLDTLAVILAGLGADGAGDVIGFNVSELAKAKKQGYDKLVTEVADVLKGK